MKNSVLWDITPCGSYKNVLFEGKYRPNHQGNNIGGSRVDNFLRNVRSYNRHSAANHTRRAQYGDGDVFERVLLCIRILWGAALRLVWVAAHMRLRSFVGAVDTPKSSPFLYWEPAHNPIPLQTELSRLLLNTEIPLFCISLKSICINYKSYTQVIHPVCSYGIQLWGCASDSNKKVKLSP
jgi:hypothetical protein